jgi:acetoin utilization protein AcuB
MRKQVVTINPSASLFEAREKMRGNDVHQLPVTGEDGRLVGILSNRDIRQEDKLLKSTAVEKVMTRKVIAATLTDTLEDAIVLLHDFRINALPVVDDQGKVAGIITRTDALKAFIEALGVGEISSRLEVVVPDRPGGLAAIVTIIKSFNVNIASLVTTGHSEEGKRAIFIRVATMNVLPLKQAIREAGFEILDPSCFHL